MSFRMPGAGIAIGVTLLCLVGCSSAPTIRYVDLSAPISGAAAIEEDQLLDIGISVFNPNVPETYDEIVEANISPEIRHAEANYVAIFAKRLLQSTGNWGAVRVIPRPSLAVDVTLTGRIIHSDGERQILEVTVQDARGIVWLDKTYECLASKYAYDADIPTGVDPFQSTYKAIADEMYLFRQGLTPQEIEEIRLTAEMRFARDFSTEAFANHISVDKSGIYYVARLPNEDDPMLGRVRKIREREYLFIDTLDEYYDGFSEQMYQPYSKWRAGTYVDAIALRKEQQKARTRLVAGTVMLVSGVGMQRSSSALTEYAGYANVIGGAGELVGSIMAHANATLHASALRELGTTISAEISPYILELENTTLSLTGTVDEQYTKLRRILKRMYFEDFNLPVPDDVVDTKNNSLDDELDSENVLDPDQI